MDTNDVIVAMQHRNRTAIHSLKGTQAMIQNHLYLSERDGWESDFVKERTPKVMQIAVDGIKELIEKLQTDIKEANNENSN